MPEATITNPSSLFGLTATAPNQTIWMTNNSGGTLTPGDVVVFGADVTGVNVTTTTTVNDKTVLGVVAAKAPSDSLNPQAGVTYAAGSSVPVVVRGPARINIGANTVAAGDLLTTAAAAKTAAVNAGAPGANANTFSIIAIALEASGAKDTATNTIRAYINK